MTLFFRGLDMWDPHVRPTWLLLPLSCWQGHRSGPDDEVIPSSLPVEGRWEGPQTPSTRHRAASRRTRSVEAALFDEEMVADTKEFPLPPLLGASSRASLYVLLSMSSSTLRGVRDPMPLLSSSRRMSSRASLSMLLGARAWAPSGARPQGFLPPLFGCSRSSRRSAVDWS
jgi:hypothetical protein